jgi:hypothetical protein
MVILYAIIIAVFFALACVIILYFGNMFRFKLLKNKVKKISQNYRERLLNPDIEAVEQYFGHALPEAIYHLYRNKEELLKKDYLTASKIQASGYLMYHIAFYEPCDKQTVLMTWPGLEKYFRFADDGCGNCYLIDPVLKNPPVIFYDHETTEKTEICNSLNDFIRWPRKYL